jgi:hypothetical protein
MLLLCTPVGTTPSSNDEKAMDACWARLVLIGIYFLVVVVCIFLLLAIFESSLNHL